jgi:hypothetical protein
VSPVGVTNYFNDLAQKKSASKLIGAQHFPNYAQLEEPGFDLMGGGSGCWTGLFGGTEP